MPQFAFSFLLASVTDCVPAELTPAVLLNMVNFKSIPPGCDHSTTEPTKVQGFLSVGSLLFCLFFHNNNNGVREPSDPRSF